MMVLILVAAPTRGTELISNNGGSLAKWATAEK